MTRKNKKITPTKELGLYIHIPFCRAKCAYCDFYSLPCGEPDRSRLKQMRRYTDALLLQLEDLSDSTAYHAVDTIYIGGGTPTMLPTNYICDILDTVYENYKVSDDAEITMEANPATVDLKALKKLYSCGINRLSLGLQSANDAELKALSRIHDYAGFLETYNNARDAGFDNISVDLMYGIPGQTKESLADTLEKVTALEPDHISLYGLRIEDGTPFAKISDTLALPDEDTEYEMYESSIAFLASKGYAQYEISNFAREGKQSRHNLKYWNCCEYLGYGAAAHSYFGGKRWAMPRDIDAYMNALESEGGTESAVRDAQTIDETESLNEYVMLRMRLNDGLEEAEFTRRFGKDFGEMYSKYLPKYVQYGYMEHRDGRYSFTTKGRYVSNYILSSMLDFEKTPDETSASASATAEAADSTAVSAPTEIPAEKAETEAAPADKAEPEAEKDPLDDLLDDDDELSAGGEESAEETKADNEKPADDEKEAK